MVESGDCYWKLLVLHSDTLMPQDIRFLWPLLRRFLVVQDCYPFQFGLIFGCERQGTYALSFTMPPVPNVAFSVMIDALANTMPLPTQP